MISVCFQGKPFNITVIQAYAPTSNAEEAEVERFYDDLQDLLELTPKKDENHKRKRGQKGCRGLGDPGKGHRAAAVFGAEAAPLTQDADRLPVALLPAGGGRASQLPAVPPQLAPDEPVEDAEA